MGPLARRAAGRLARGGVWGLLVAGAFALLATAAASVPMFREAAGDAALTERIAAVPPDASVADAAAVRLVGGENANGASSVAGGLAGIPGLGPGSATATSVGSELLAYQSTFSPFLSADEVDDRAAPSALGAATGRARLFGDDDLARSLVPAAGSRLPPAEAAPAAGEPAVWIPAPLATRLGLGPGDRARAGVRLRTEVRATPVRIAGVYEVGADGRSPVDAPGSRRWRLRAPDVPRDVESRTQPAYLLVTDVATAGRVAGAVDETLLYALEAGLEPARPTLAAARATAAAVRRQQVEVRDLAGDVERAGLDRQVVSGIPEIVDDAGEVADRTVAWTSTAGAGGIGLGLVAVLAVAVFGLNRRTLEVRHAVGVGIRPATVALLAAVEVLPVAVLATAAGVGAARLLLVPVGPPGRITGDGVRDAVAAAAPAVAAGVVLVAVTTLLVAARAARLGAPAVRARPVPWEVPLVAVAATATAGLLLRPAVDGPPGVLDLLVPVLLPAAVGAVAGRLALGAAGRWAPAATARAWSRRPAATLALRRVAAGGTAAVLLVSVLAAGLGVLGYALAAASSVRAVTGDRVAVIAGAASTVEVRASWLLDPAAPVAPPLEGVFGEYAGESVAPVPGTRVPPLTPGTTVVWRARTTVPPEYGNVDLLVVDPRAFAAAASWGSGPELARARSLLAGLAAEDDRVEAELRAGRRGDAVPAIGVGPLLQRAGDRAGVRTLTEDVPVRVRDVVPAFPGFGERMPMLVVPADSFFTRLGRLDPRLRPRSAAEGTIRLADFLPAVWSSRDLAATRSLLDARGVTAGTATSMVRIAQDPDLVAARRATGYLAGLGACTAALAALGLAMYAERSAARTRAADLMLTRMGLGRGGATRAAAVQIGLLAAVALAAAAAGVALTVPLGPRLLEPGVGLAPAFALRPDGAAVAATGAAALAAVLLALVVSRPGAGAATGRRVWPGGRRRARNAAQVLRDAG